MKHSKFDRVSVGLKRLGIDPSLFEAIDMVMKSIMESDGEEIPETNGEDNDSENTTEPESKENDTSKYPKPGYNTKLLYNQKRYGDGNTLKKYLDRYSGGKSLEDYAKACAEKDKEYIDSVEMDPKSANDKKNVVDDILDKILGNMEKKSTLCIPGRCLKDLFDVVKKGSEEDLKTYLSAYAGEMSLKDYANECAKRDKEHMDKMFGGGHMKNDNTHIDKMLDEILERSNSNADDQTEASDPVYSESGNNISNLYNAIIYEEKDYLSKNAGKLNPVEYANACAEKDKEYIDKTFTDQNERDNKKAEIDKVLEFIKNGIPDNWLKRHQDDYTESSATVSFSVDKDGGNIEGMYKGKVSHMFADAKSSGMSIYEYIWKKLSADEEAISKVKDPEEQEKEREKIRYMLGVIMSEVGSQFDPTEFARDTNDYNKMIYMYINQEKLYNKATPGSTNDKELKPEADEIRGQTIHGWLDYIKDPANKEKLQAQREKMAELIRAREERRKSEQEDETISPEATGSQDEKENKTEKKRVRKRARNPLVQI